ncbi:hypothetical protein [Qipengyuania sp.]|uniref:hypothetical protein n=1 Tax=Qipengyuania sp. TaxID=2004515 RepID=UPI0035C7E4CA
MFALGCGVTALPANLRPPSQPAAPPIAAIAADGWKATMIEPQELAFKPVSVSRQGFGATGAATIITESLLTTKRVRKPYPLHKHLTADTVALSDYVYATDTIAGVANNSTVTSPKPVVNWIMPHRLVVGSTLEAELTAFHRNAGSGRQVACVEFIATDKDGATATVKVGLPVVSNRAGDRNAVIAYKANIDVSALASGLIKLDARVYPRVGGATSVADSASDGHAARGFSTRYFLKNTGARTLAYVKTAANGGNDGSGVVSINAATASASPFATISAAITALDNALKATSGIDMGEIRTGDDGGTPFVLGATAAHRTQRVAALTITRDPAVPRANARVSFGSASFGPYLGTGGSLTAPLTTGALVLKDIGVVRTGTGNIVGNGASAQLEVMFDNCTFDNGNNNNPWISQAHDYHFGTSFTNVSSANSTILNASTFEHRLLRGISLTPSAYSASGFAIEGWCVIGSHISNAKFERGARLFSGAIQAFNTLPNPGSSVGTIGIGETDVHGFAFVQNVVEYSTDVTGPAVRLSADSAVGSNSHVILHNNTHAGALLAGRWNAFYDDGPTRRTSTLQSVVGNIAVAVFSKCDVFRGTNQSDASGTAQGNWAFIHGVGCRSNFSQFMAEVPNETGADRVQDYPGVGSVYGTSEIVRNDPLFTDYRGTTIIAVGNYVAGAGAGAYTLLPGSPAGAMLSDPVLPFGLNGNSRNAANDAAGAYAA